MRILVTGGAGFIGSHTVDALLARGHQVRVLDSLEPPVHAGRRPDYLPAEVELIVGDVTDPAALERALTGIDAVVHLAAYQDYLPDFSRFFRVNASGTALLYEIIVAKRLPIGRVLIASSQAVYGEGLHRCPEHGATYPGQRPPEQLERRDWDVRCPRCGLAMEPDWTPEDAPLAPHNSYGLSKRDAEEIGLRLGRRYGIPTVALRYSIVQGPRQSFRNAYSGALRAFAVRLLAGRPLVVFEDGRQVRDYVSIHDVVAANLLALTDDRVLDRAFAVGGDRRVTVLELAAAVCRAVGRDLEPELPGAYRMGDTRHALSDIAGLRSLGWRPHVPQETMVREYVDWASTQPDLQDTFEAAEARMRAMGVVR